MTRPTLPTPTPALTGPVDNFYHFKEVLHAYKCVSTLCHRDVYNENVLHVGINWFPCALQIKLHALFFCRCAPSVSKSVHDATPSSSTYSLKYLIMDMCVSSNAIPVFQTSNNELSRKDCIRIKQDMDTLLESWKLEKRRKISEEMEEMSDNIEVILRCKMHKLLIAIQKIIYGELHTCSDEDKWILNSLMTCDAEQSLKIHHKIIRTSEQREEELRKIKSFYRQSAQATYETLQKHKSFERYLMSKEDNLSQRICKVIYYLRNVYFTRPNVGFETVPDFVLDLMCGHDPLDEDLYLQHCSGIHMKSVSCQKSLKRRKCTFKHYNFHVLAYNGTTPNYSVVYENILTKL